MSKLIILRGNSGSGKSTVALAVAQSASGKVAVIDADHYREHMLFPKPAAKEDLAALMSQDVLYCLEHDYTVLWDSIFYANDRNKTYLGEFFTKLHPSDNFVFNFDVSFEETARRHKQRPKSDTFSAEQMKEWYQPVEPLGYDFEYTIPETYSAEEATTYIRRIASM